MEFNKEKQIEGMAKDIFVNCDCGLFYSEAERIADFVINEQGYRKASDVAEEIFAEIEKCFFEELVGCSETKLLDEEMFAELKKKYTEGKG